MNVQHHHDSIDSNITIIHISSQNQSSISPGESAVTAVAQSTLVSQAESLNEENVNKPGQWGSTKLMDAAMANDQESVHTLIRARASIEARDDGGYTVLMTMALLGNKDVMRLLIDARADVEARDQEGQTMLQSATRLREKEVVELLIDARADVEPHDEAGHTPLMNAVSNGDVVVAQLLIDAHAKIETRDTQGNNALFFAMVSGQKEMISLLEKHGANKEYVKDLCNKRYMADVLKQIKHSNTETRDREGCTPLITAAISGHEEAMQALLHAGVHIEARDNKNYTALMHATIAGHPQIVQMLLNAKANIEAPAERGQTALMQASKLGRIEIARLLLDAGAKIEPCCEDGFTPITFALSYCKTEMFDFLRERGANSRYATEFMRRKFLAASWGIADQSHLRNTKGNYETIFQLEGTSANYTSLKLFYYTKEFFALNLWIERFLSKEQQEQVCRTILNRYSLFSSHLSAEILDKIQSGEPVVILSGCSYHHISTIINKQNSSEYQLTICNRGDGRTAQSTNMYSISLKQMTETVIEKLRAKSYATGDAFNEMIASLKLTPIGGFSQKPQKIGNCTWANTKTLVRVLCGLYIKDNAIANKIYKAFTQFAREKVIHEYLEESSDLDIGLIKKIYRKYINKKPGLVLSEEVIKKLDVILMQPKGYCNLTRLSGIQINK